MKKRKIYWVSRHELSPAQKRAIYVLHGEDVEIVKDPVVFEKPEDLANYIHSHSDGFVYAVAGAPHYLYAALVEGCRFGVFENYPKKREDGTFGLAAVYHINCGQKKFQKVWVNPDPESDYGEPLVPPTPLS